MIFARCGHLSIILALLCSRYQASSNQTERDLEPAEYEYETETPTDDDYQVPKPAHYQLEAFLLTNYSKRLLPKRFLNESVEVKFSMELYQIIEVNEPSQYMLINAWIVERWYDDLLYWNPKDFANITEIILPRACCWIPDTTLYNSLVMNDADSARLLNVKLSTEPKRRSTLVTMLYPTLYQFSCMLDLRFFPFDIQACKLTFGSWTHDIKSIDYHVYNPSGKTGAIGLDQCIENEGWTILGTNVRRREEKYECCVNKYTLLEYSLLIRRKPLYYLVNLIAPTSIVTLISILGFFSSSTINEYREEKITLGITTLLSMSIMIFMVADKMPSTSSFIPLIGWFYTCMMMLISGGTLCASVVIVAQKKGILGNRPPTKTMRWARYLGHLCRLQMPLLMKEAYMEKARLEKEKLKRDSLLKRQRRQSIWQKISRSSLPIGVSANPNSTTLPKSVSLNTPSLKKVVIDASSELPTLCCEELEDATDEDRSYILDNSYSEALPPKRVPDFSRNSTLLDIDPFNSLGSVVKNVGGDTGSGRRRNLAEIEYDWLAAVVERCFLIVFSVLFVLFSFGINSIGLYYWWYAKIEDFIED